MLVRLHFEARESDRNENRFVSRMARTCGFLEADQLTSFADHSESVHRPGFNPSRERRVGHLSMTHASWRTVQVDGSSRGEVDPYCAQGFEWPDDMCEDARHGWIRDRPARRCVTRGEFLDGWSLLAPWDRLPAYCVEDLWKKS